MAGIVWLASYPKSGNTWIRVFLTNYVRNADAPADINKLDGGPIAADRRMFDDAAGVEASELSLADVVALRADVFRDFARTSPRTTFVKIHDAYRRPGEPSLIPADVSLGAVYIVRNPLDVAVSFANHEGLTLDDSVDRLCQSVTVARSVHRLRLQLEQTLLTWSEHVISWTEQSEVPCTTVRYEDLLADAEQTFRVVLAEARLPIEPERLRRAIAFSSFDTVSRQEATAGFREKPLNSTAFFRRGRSGDWRDALTSSQVARIVDAHHDVMKRFGYLPGTSVAVGEPG